MQHLDLMGRELVEGDCVAYPTMRGSTASMTVARIVEIIDSEREVTKSSYIPETGERSSWRETALFWKVRLQPLYYSTRRWSDEGGLVPAKQVTVEKVKNLVKVDLGEEG